MVIVLPNPVSSGKKLGAYKKYLLLDSEQRRISCTHVIKKEVKSQPFTFLSFRVRLMGANKTLKKVLPFKMGTEPHNHLVKRDGTGPLCSKAGTIQSWVPYMQYTDPSA